MKNKALMTNLFTEQFPDSVFVEMKFLARFVFLDAIPCGKICSRGILISPVGSGQFLH